MKESHDHLLRLCSPLDENFLNIEVPPRKIAKRKKGNLPLPVPNDWFLTDAARYTGEVQPHREVQ